MGYRNLVVFVSKERARGKDALFLIERGKEQWEKEEPYPFIFHIEMNRFQIMKSIYDSKYDETEFKELTGIEKIIYRKSEKVFFIEDGKYRMRMEDMTLDMLKSCFLFNCIQTSEVSAHLVFPDILDGCTAKGMKRILSYARLSPRSCIFHDPSGLSLLSAQRPDIFYLARENEDGLTSLEKVENYTDIWNEHFT